mgnify:CR=1 FL=1
MSRAQIFEGIVTALNADATLIPGILGPRTVTNQRLYRAFPQTQSLLSGYEPDGGEGWLVIEEPQSGIRNEWEQYSSVVELIEVTFHVFATRYSIADDVTDVLDSLFQFSVEQQRDIQYGERVLLFSRRVRTEEKYQLETKLYVKILGYRMQYMLGTLPA